MRTLIWLWGGRNASAPKSSVKPSNAASQVSGLVAQRQIFGVRSRCRSEDI
jgi:hypothetical protein